MEDADGVVSDSDQELKRQNNKKFISKSPDDKSPPVNVPFGNRALPFGNWVKPNF